MKQKVKNSKSAYQVAQQVTELLGELVLLATGFAVSGLILFGMLEALVKMTATLTGAGAG